MSIKSKRWYENQIKALENAARNTGRMINQGRWFITGSKAYEEEQLLIQKENAPIQAECRKIYEELNRLKDEYALYWRN